MLQIKDLKPVEEVKEVKRWPYVKHSFPNGKESYWIGWKIHPDDEKFFPANKGIYIRFDKELNHLGNENISAMNEFKVTRKSYVYRIEDICDALNFFETMYDKEGELITALFEVKCLVDVNEYYYPLKSYPAFIKKVYDTIFTPTMLKKIQLMVEENYADDIEIDESDGKDINQLTVIQQKKRSLAFTNDQVKAMLEVSFCTKILAFIVNHFLVMRSVNVQKNLEYFYNAFKPAFDLFEHDFNVYNKIYAYVESKIAMKVSYNKAIFNSLNELFLEFNRGFLS